MATISLLTYSIALNSNAHTFLSCCSSSNNIKRQMFDPNMKTLAVKYCSVLLSENYSNEPRRVYVQVNTDLSPSPHNCR